MSGRLTSCCRIGCQRCLSINWTIWNTCFLSLSQSIKGTEGHYQKMTFAMFLSYAWNNEQCFPGQERLAEDIGAGVRSVNRFIKGLEEKGFLTIQRRGLGKTNIYTLRYQVKKVLGKRI